MALKITTNQVIPSRDCRHCGAKTQVVNGERQHVNGYFMCSKGRPTYAE